MFKPCDQQVLSEFYENSFSKMLPKATQLYPLLTTSLPVTDPVNYRLKLQNFWPNVYEFLLLAAPHLHTKLHQDLIVFLLTFLAPMSKEQSSDFLKKFGQVYGRARVLIDESPDQEEKPLQRRCP